MKSPDETTSLISASKVTGTNVFNTDGDQLGEIHDVMLDKKLGKIAYAVMSFGGFLGIGERYHPLPWAALKYDTRQGGYVVGLTIDDVGPWHIASRAALAVLLPWSRKLRVPACLAHSGGKRQLVARGTSSIDGLALAWQGLPGRDSAHQSCCASRGAASR